MNHKKAFLLFVICGLLLASGVKAKYDDDDYYDDDFDSPDRYDGSRDQPYPPRDRFSPRDRFPPKDDFPQGEDQDQGFDEYKNDASQDNRPFDLTYLTKEKNPYFDAICTAKDRCVTNCQSSYQDGCICYNDGTCTQQYVNRCHQCTDPNVYAVFEGTTCPRQPYPQICEQINQDQGSNLRLKRHRKRDSKRKGVGLKVLCTGEKLKSCVCDLQGDCILRMLDICDVCQSNHYSAIFLNSTCPDNSLRATCDSTPVLPAPTTCNNPQAYLCQDQDRKAMTCDLQSSALACVCYSNGTCVSEPLSSCACQNTDIVSVFAGSSCPTNCTTNITKPEKGESSESEEAETETESEKAEKSEEAESEGESKNEESESKSKSKSEKSESKPVAPIPVPNNTMANLSDEFTPKNPNRFIKCQLPNSYNCSDGDRGATSCSSQVVDSCICNSAGICISVPTNKCKACANSDIVTVLENGTCSSSCQKFDAQNIAPQPRDDQKIANQTIANQPVANQSTPKF